MIQNVVSDMQSFKEQKGHYPNWLEFDQLYGLDRINQRLKNTSAYPLQQHYVFVTNKIPMLGYQQGDVFLIRTEPFRDRDGWRVRKGRYIISKYEGVLLFNWVPEEKVQQMLAKTGVKELPKPEPWVPRPNNAAQLSSEANSQVEAKSLPLIQRIPSKTWKGIAVVAFILALLGWMIFRRAKKR